MPGPLPGFFMSIFLIPPKMAPVLLTHNYSKPSNFYMKKLVVLSLAGLFFLAGCKKDDKCDLSSSSIVGTYRTTSITYKASAGSPEVDVYSNLDACAKDDLVIFNDNGSVIFQDAGMVCSPSGTDTGNWSLSGNTILLDGEAGTVSSFDCDAMVLSMSDVTTGETSTVRLVRQ